MGTATGLHPRKETLSVVVPARAAGVAGAVVIGKAPFAGAVTKATYVPVADIAGTALPDTRTLAVVNKQQNGNGAVSVAALALLAGVNAADFDEKDLTLDAVAANRDVAKGDVLAWTSTHAGAGLADPGGTVIVEITRD